MKMNYDNEKKRAEIFSQRKTIVHASKVDGIFSNGIILEVGNDFFILKDRVNETENFILFSELSKPLEPFKEVEE